MLVEGMAVPFLRDSVRLYEPTRKVWYVEQIAPGAFARYLRKVTAGDRRVRALRDHHESQMLGSTERGYFREGGDLWVVERRDGLWFQLDTVALSLCDEATIRAGRMSVSIGIIPGREAWDWCSNPPRRLLHQIEALHEISLVTEAAYPQTFARRARGWPGDAPRRWRFEAVAAALR